MVGDDASTGIETMARHGLNIMTVVLNDGGYGSEVHKLRASGATLAGSVFGRLIASVGRGFGLVGTTATTQDNIARPFIRVSKFWFARNGDVQIRHDRIATTNGSNIRV